MATTITVGVFENSLKIRFSDGAARYYKSLSKNLIGKFSLSHWDDKKKQIKSSAVNSSENNSTISEILSQYSKALAENKAIDPYSLCHFFDDRKQFKEDYTLGQLLLLDIEKEKKKKGCNYKNYEKLYRRLIEFNPNIDKLSISKVNERFCVSLRDWLTIKRPKTNYEKTTKCFMAFLRRVSDDKSINWNISAINNYSFKEHSPDEGKIEEMPVILTQDELKSFYNLNPLTCLGKRDESTVELF